MIKLIDNADELYGYAGTDIYSIRIMSLVKAYGVKYDFVRFYCQYDNDGKLTAIISRLDGDVTLSFIKTSNTAELAEFIRVIGYSSLLCDSSFKYNANYNEGIVMSASKKADYVLGYSQIDEYPKLMDLYNFVDYDSADFESWYVDISHRIRHNCAKAFTLNVNDEIVSSGIFSAIYNDNAILSAVKTEPVFRNMGYGSTLVSAMMNDIRGTVFLMRNKDINENFYNRLGFENIGKWRLYK